MAHVVIQEDLVECLLISSVHWKNSHVCLLELHKVWMMDFMHPHKVWMVIEHAEFGVSIC